MRGCVIMDLKRRELQKLINRENGRNYHKNINLTGYTVYRKDSFITFHFVQVNGINTVMIDYIYVTSKKDLIKLLSFCIHYFAGNKVRFIYYKEHKRQANYVSKYFNLLGFKLADREMGWKHDWQSTNGYSENEVLEAYL